MQYTMLLVAALTANFAVASDATDGGFVFISPSGVWDGNAKKNDAGAAAFAKKIAGK